MFNAPRVQGLGHFFLFVESFAKLSDLTNQTTQPLGGWQPEEFQNFLEYHRLNWLCQTENQKMEPLLGRHRNHLYPVNSDSKEIVVTVDFPAEERLNFYRTFKAVNPVKSKILQIHLIILKIILSFKCTSKSSYSSCISEKK